MDINDRMLGSGVANREINMVNSIVNRGNTGVNDLPNFEDLLKRAAAPQPETPAAPEPSVMQAANARGTVTVDKTSKLYEQCLELEIFMVKTLISSMRNTVQKSGLIEEGFAGKMYEDMLYDEYAREYTKNANFGMAELAYLELTGQRGKVITR
jgi:flagellar protein FlgJ